MDTLDRYREIIQHILKEYTTIPYAYGEITTELIVSQNSQHFLLMDEGWQNGVRVHDCLVHIQIRDDKIWIHQDGTDEGIADKLVAAGIPKQQIVLGFHPPELRQHTEFAIA